MLNFRKEIHKQGLLYHLIIYLLVFSVFLTLLATAIQLFHAYRYEKAMIEMRFQEIQDVHMQTLVDALRASDRVELEDHLEAIFQFHNIQFLKIQQQGKVIIEVGTPLSSDSLSRQYPLSYLQNAEEVRIGTFTMSASLDEVYQHLRDKFWPTLVSSGISILLLAGFSLFVLYSLNKTIVEQLEVNKKLRETSLFLDNIVENVPNMIFLKRASDLRFEFLNRAGEKLLGLGRSELLGRNDYDFFPEQQADFFTARDREVLTQHEVMDIPEEVIDTADGKRILHTRKIALRDEQGVAQYLLGISEDITGRKQADEELKQFRNTLDKMLDCILMFDAEELRFTYANKGAIQQLGYSRDELLKLHPYDIDSEHSEESFREMVFPLMLDEEKTLNFETLHQKKSGENIFVDVFMQCIGSGDKPATFIIVANDIGERKLMETELDNYREHLEELVEERSTELIAARDEAERANAAKSEFLSSMSHELRTPMNAILGFAQLLELDAEGFNSNQRDNIQEIIIAGHHLLSLINEVLDLAKIESGKLETTIEAVSLTQTLQQCISLMRGELESKQIELIDHVSDKDYVVQADVIRLKQVWLNLCSNAVKYNRQRGRITLDSEIIAPHRLRIYISDTGQGIKQQDLGKLFTSFGRLDTENNIEGTGIGLVISKRLMALMGGSIGVESVWGEGSRFWIELALSD